MKELKPIWLIITWIFSFSLDFISKNLIVIVFHHTKQLLSFNGFKSELGMSWIKCPGQSQIPSASLVIPNSISEVVSGSSSRRKNKTKELTQDCDKSSRTDASNNSNVAVALLNPEYKLNFDALSKRTER
ncbi:unnamed protein product [Orchesella dallaii]|uniref:Uncharacterized protein n=1 Tax=Orchesella dallaii TaxID=48710 RepID=A0ABP1RC09_9HEXA